MSYLQQAQSSGFSASIDTDFYLAHDILDAVVPTADFAYIEASETSAWESSINASEHCTFTIWKTVDGIEQPVFNFSIKPEVSLTQDMSHWVWQTASPSYLQLEVTVWKTIHQSTDLLFDISPQIPWVGVSESLHLYNAPLETVLDLQNQLWDPIDVSIIFEPNIEGLLPKVIWFNPNLYGNTEFGDVKKQQDLTLNNYTSVSTEMYFDFEFGTDVGTSTYFEGIIYDTTFELSLGWYTNLYRHSIEPDPLVMEGDIIAEIDLPLALEFRYSLRTSLEHINLAPGFSAAAGEYNIWAPAPDVSAQFIQQIGNTPVEVTKYFRNHIDPSGAGLYTPTILRYTNQIILDEGTSDERDVTGLIENCRVTYGIKQYVGTVDITWAEPSIYEYVTVTSADYFGQLRISVYTTEVGGPTIDHGKFILESRNTSVDFSTINPKSTGRSKPALLGNPYAIPITKMWAQDLLASDIAEEVAYRDHANQLDQVAVSWEIDNFKILPGNFEVAEQLPINIISTLARVVGGVLTTDKTGTLRAVYRFGE
jgi:hypothetical protein